MVKFFVIFSLLAVVNTTYAVDLKSEFASINKLKQGGYIIYFRHGLTEKKPIITPGKKRLLNCKYQRNLSVKGIAQLKEMSVAIKALAIPVDEVFTSPYCRAKDTAKILFGRMKVDMNLRYATHLKKTARESITQELKNRLSRAPAKGMNTVLVSHTSNLKEAADIWPKPESVAHVFKPLADTGYKHIGIINPGSWIKAAINQ